MRNETRQAFNAYLAQQAELNGADPESVRAGAKFAIAHESYSADTPSVQQRLIDAAGESSEFLSRINVVGVSEMAGETLGLGVNTPIASRTNTNASDRLTKDPSGMTARGYQCVQTNSDTHIRYAKLDMWAKFADFQSRVSAAIVRQQARDRIMIGFNGVSIAANTDLAAHPLLQDVNKGWLQKYREYLAGAKVLDEGEVETGKIIIDPTDGDYKNLDALIVDAKYSLMPSWARDDTELVVILGSDLAHDHYFPLVNNNLEPSEKLSADLILSAKQIGGLQGAKVPFFPPNAAFVTRYDNLSLYEQEGARRRAVIDNPKRDRIETYESSNDDYVIEDFDFGFLVENIQFGRTA
jgi:P2 family phage major capsid protein